MLLELVIWNLRFIIIPGEMYLEQGNYSFLSRRIILAGSKGKLGHLFRGFLKVGNSSKTFPPFCPNFYLSPSSLFTRIVSKKFSSRDKSKWSINLFEKRDTFFFFLKKYRDLQVFFFLHLFENQHKSWSTIEAKRPHRSRKCLKRNLWSSARKLWDKVWKILLFGREFLISKLNFRNNIPSSKLKRQERRLHSFLRNNFHKLISSF